MRNLGIMLALSTVLLVCGCSTGSAPTNPQTVSTPTPTSPPATPPPQAPSIAGNWQFTSDTSVPGSMPLAIAGGINQSGTAVNGVMHIEGSKCFDQAVPVGISGDLSTATPSLTLPNINGQLITLTGNFNGATFSGRYTINGGCADGAKGAISGMSVALGNLLNGTFTSSTAKTFSVTGDDVAESSTPSAQGSFEVTGNATFNTTCFSAGTIKPGIYPSASYLLGMSLVLEFDTSNGILSFSGTLNPTLGEFIGTYSVSGGNCSDSGTAALRAIGPWDY